MVLLYLNNIFYIYVSVETKVVTIDRKIIGQQKHYSDGEEQEENHVHCAD